MGTALALNWVSVKGPETGTVPDMETGLVIEVTAARVLAGFNNELTEVSSANPLVVPMFAVIVERGVNVVI